MLNRHEALIHGMVMMAAADEIMTQSEMDMIGRIVTHLPIFRDFDATKLSQIAEACLAKLEDENGIDLIIEEMKDGLPVKLRETAYALAVEVAAADLEASDEELNLLQMIRQKLELDRLICTGIERGVRARFTTL
ncbi:MAG: tellurite resistance TerB family protein [Alphaproteobacteria bacterium]|jgi:tellurite resistance protein|uniref:tellurite resistance TerB family protein n=1 Tax=Pacificispira sp. TaxID=2888761 RepID=UPI001B0D7608|nr:tellurite resistance TerB family protein [Alphaproteobacteria bacterium]MBO6864954.1 tellurite resistance TerB family protein [Alphaproteobacteria bacterium]MEC9265100.1 tellurite resistance TerB family protein [Pseudomonadota bacterium]